MVEGLKTTKCQGLFRHQQTYYLKDHKYETAVLGLEKKFSIIKCKNVHILIYIHTRKQTFKNT